jgi:hypothetical protein
MNDDLEYFDTDLCGKLFNFIYPDEKDMTREEVQAELQQLEIDTRSIKRKLALALNSYTQTQKAKGKLATAKEQRLSFLEKIKNAEVRDVPSVRSKLQELIAHHLDAPLQAAYFRKLEDAATDQDLQSLLQDILLLESFDKDESDEEQ